ncbi:hypothetical protein INT80_09440 [Gallibacterium anatis]|uniref:Uncharacterized protein n=1 Tax=Gallibacterium anatis TaxID=750 RepID=A0A930UU40_9PAST|nr:hypothetical protein [Gallibacterium anatis]
METVRHQNVADRYWKIIQHPKGLGCYAVEMVKRTHTAERLNKSITTSAANATTLLRRS